MYKGQIICIIIISFIGAFYFTSSRKKTESSRWFSSFIIISLIQLLFDIFSCYTVNHLESVSEILNRAVHCFYMGFLILLFYIAYKYLEALIEEEIGDSISRFKYSIVPLIGAVFGAVFLPIRYVETPKGNYSYGPAAYMIYISVAIYVILIFRILLKYRKVIPRKKRKAIKIALICELLGGIYQAIVPTALITCLGITLLALGFYMTVENPDAILVELLEKETKRADVANQAKTNFLANMSHEIRTPIGAVLGMNEMILRESKEPVIKEYARDVEGAAKSLLSIINDILDITKIEAGKLTIIPVEYGFSSMIHDVVSMISFKAKAKGLEFQISIDERIPSKLMGDDVRIRQILVNLLNNAIKYTHEGTVTLEVKLLPKEQEHMASISFLVKDTGIGIKAEDIPKLYVPFERIEEKRNRNIEGTGLGMNITMELLSMLDSKLVVESEYGKGSEFSFVLNQEIMNPEPIGKLGEQMEVDKKEQDYQVTYEAPEAKVLVVDDNEMNRKVFGSLLKDTKIQVEEAASGRECIAKVKNTAYDIIFMDHMMPEMDGIETFKVMKVMEDYPSKNAPVVILTANAIVGAKEQYLSEGFDAFLSKPIDFQKLEALIEELLDKKLIHYIEKDSTKLAEKGSDNSVELPVIDGVDWNYAVSHFKSEKDMLNSLKLFLSAIEYEAKELEALYCEIHLEEGRKNYCIKVHSMKNTASIVGIIPLAGMAKVLEDAARNNEWDILNQMTPIFIKRWLGYKEHLSVFADISVEKKAAKEFQEQVDEILLEIKAAAEDMDVDTLDGALKKLEEFQFESEQEEFFGSIKKAIVNLDVDFLEKI